VCRAREDSHLSPDFFADGFGSAILHSEDRDEWPYCVRERHDHDFDLLKD
jgi:hypothetical protein